MPRGHGQATKARRHLVQAIIVSLAGLLASTDDSGVRASAAGHTDRGAGQQTYQERVNVSRIVVDARVVDGAGAPIKGLTIPDFEVKINGKTAGIDSIEWVPSESGDLTVPASRTAPVITPSPPGRTIVFLYEKKPDLSEITGPQSATQTARS